MIQNTNIKGINICGIRQVLSQYIDDTDVFTVYDRESLTEIIAVFQDFTKNTGLKVNYHKTTVYRIGRIKDSICKMDLPLQMKWSNEALNVLGVMVAGADVQQENYMSVLKKAEAITKLWRTRNLILQGRIMVANTLIGSLFVYKMQVLNNMDAKYINHANYYKGSYGMLEGQSLNIK